MYETYSALRRPARSRQHLWRYYSEDRLVDLLNSSELFFTHLPSFTDRLEGVLTNKSHARLLRWYVAHGSAPATAVKEVVEYEKLRDHFYANCWHMSDHESYLMWKAYADRGYAIRTTFERTQAAFDSFPGVISGGTVDYVDFSRDDVELGNAFTLAVTKDLPYRDEREFRLIFWKPEPRNEGHPILHNGTRVPVDLSFLVERVYVSPFLTQPSALAQRVLRQREIEWTSSSISVHQGALIRHAQSGSETTA